MAAAGYLAATSVAVLLLLMALSSELKLAGRKPAYPRSDESAPLSESLLYFQMIGSRPLGKWLRMWDRPSRRLEADLQVQFVREAHNLSERARVKYSLTDEAAAIYIYGLMYLAVGFLLGIHALQRPELSSATFSLAGWPIGLAIAVTATHALIQLYNLYQHERSVAQVSWLLAARKAREGSTEELNETLADAARLGDAQYWTLRSTLLLMPLVPVYVTCAGLLAVTHGNLRGILAAVAAISAAGAGVVIWPRFRQIDGRRRMMVPVVAAVGAVLPIVASILEWSLMAIVLMIVPATAMSAFTVTRQLQNFKSEVVRYRNLLRPEPDEVALSRRASREKQLFDRVMAAERKAYKNVEPEQPVFKAKESPALEALRREAAMEAKRTFDRWKRKARS